MVYGPVSVQLHHRSVCRSRGQKTDPSADPSLFCNDKVLNRDDRAVNCANQQKKMDGNVSIFWGDHGPLLSREDCGSRPVKGRTEGEQVPKAVKSLQCQLLVLKYKTLIPCHKSSSLITTEIHHYASKDYYA